jgi:hypothetical protein
MADLNNYLGGGGKTVKMHDQRDRIRSANEDELRELLNDVQGELLNLRTQAIMQQAPESDAHPSHPQDGGAHPHRTGTARAQGRQRIRRKTHRRFARTSTRLGV